MDREHGRDPSLNNVKREDRVTGTKKKVPQMVWEGTKPVPPTWDLMSIRLPDYPFPPTLRLKTYHVTETPPFPLSTTSVDTGRSFPSRP